MRGVGIKAISLQDNVTIKFIQMKSRSSTKLVAMSWPDFKHDHFMTKFSKLTVS